jgi:hypothetical protein
MGPVGWLVDDKLDLSLSKCATKFAEANSVNLVTLCCTARPGNTKGGSITVPLTSYLTGLE